MTLSVNESVRWLTRICCTESAAAAQKAPVMQNMLRVAQQFAADMGKAQAEVKQAEVKQCVRRARPEERARIAGEGRAAAAGHS